MEHRSPMLMCWCGIVHKPAIGLAAGKLRPFYGMADFAASTGLQFQMNTGSNGAPTWTALSNSGSSGANELRFSDLSTQGAVASASWPYTTRPGSTSAATFQYQYAFTADTTSLGYLGGGTNTPIAWANANYNDKRWSWDAVGTFASAPIITMYPTNAHGSVTRGDNSPLGGNTTDTGATARSYFKANAWGRVTSAGGPAAAPTNAPVVTDGATGVLTPTAGANFLTNYQGLQGDNDYIQFPSTPAATTADSWPFLLMLFCGPGMSTGSYSALVLSCRYTFG